MAQPTVDDLQAKLPASITLDSDYPGTAPALLPIVDILDAFASVQAEQAALNTTPGGDVSSLTVGVGAEQLIFYPPGQTTTSYNVRPKVYTLSMFQKSSVTDVFPIYS